MLPAQANLQFLYGQNGYMFPRADHVVIGGTFEVGVNDETSDKAVCQDLVNHIKSLFGLAPVRPLPEIHIHHPNHAPIVNPALPSVYAVPDEAWAHRSASWLSPLPTTSSSG